MTDDERIHYLERINKFAADSPFLVLELQMYVVFTELFLNLQKDGIVPDENWLEDKLQSNGIK